MQTIGDVYNPLIEAALQNAGDGAELIKAVGEKILKANPDRCPNLADGIEAAKRNLDYYCQYFDAETARRVKDYYDLGSGFRTITGMKLQAV